VTSTGTTDPSFETEVSLGERFKFGENWRAFLKVLNEERIEEAIQSLKTMLRLDTLQGLRFVDAGSGRALKWFPLTTTLHL
jgi:hypothetical protein